DSRNMDVGMGAEIAVAARILFAGVAGIIAAYPDMSRGGLHINVILTQTAAAVRVAEPKEETGARQGIRESGPRLNGHRAVIADDPGRELDVLLGGRVQL